MRHELGEGRRDSKKVFESRTGTELIPRKELALIPEAAPLLAVVLEGTRDALAMIAHKDGTKGIIRREEVLAETLSGLGRLQDLFLGDEEFGLVVDEGDGRRHCRKN